MTGSRRLLILVIGAVLAGSAGCASVPTSSPVHVVEATAAGEGTPLVQYAPPGPGPRDTPVQVVRGFLDAMLAFPQSSAVAAEFLSPNARSSWRPQERTLVYGSGSTATQSRTGRVDFVADKVASLTRRGTFVAGSPGQRVRFHFRLHRVYGHWRIVNPPNALVVTEDYFARYYAPFSLYFFDPSGSILVPDPVYLPSGDQTATLLVRGLLRGPTADLGTAVRSLVPTSTQVDLSVPVQPDGTAQVPLSPQVLSLSPDQRQLLAAQLVWTLRQVPEVTGVKITVEGRALDVPGSRPVESVSSWAGYDPAVLAASQTLYAVRAGRVVSVAPTSVQPVPGVWGGRPHPIGSVAVDLRGDRLVAVSLDGHRLMEGDLGRPEGRTPTTPNDWYTGQHLLPPAIDRTDLVWLVDQTGQGARLVTVRNGQPSVVPAPGLDGRDVRAFAVARDGVRVAAIVAGRRWHLVLGRVLRSDDGDRVLRVDHVHTVTTPGLVLTDMRDLAWVSPTSVVVLARSAGQSLQPYALNIDGSGLSGTTTVAAGSMPAFGATSIATSPNPGVPLIVASRRGQLWSRDAEERWGLFTHVTGLRAPTFAG